MNSRQGFALWRGQHPRVFYASCLVVGGTFGSLVTLLPQPLFTFVMLPVTVFVLVAAARMYRHTRKVGAAWQRLHDAAERDDEAAFEAAILDLAVLLPSARKPPPAAPDGSHESLG